MAIVDSGYTELNAALVTARAGRPTMVLDAGNPGWGCSTKNGGQFSTSNKQILENLTSRYDTAKVRAIHQKAIDVLNWIDDFIQTKGAKAYAVPLEQQHRELSADTNYGGMVFPHHASLDPAKSHRALLHRAIEAGVHVTADRTAAGEYCHSNSGRASVSNVDGSSTREIGPGDLLVLPQGWVGEWTIHEHMRKLFVTSADA